MLIHVILLAFLAEYGTSLSLTFPGFQRDIDYRALGLDPITDEQNAPEPTKKPQIRYLKVNSEISNRYAKTVVTSNVVNVDRDRSREAEFNFILPEDAFIIAFSMEIGGKKYDAYIKEKEEAKREYINAVNRHQTAAHIYQSARDSNRFTASVNIEPQAKVTFMLHYEELLQREFGAYNHVINLNPGQIIPKIEVDIHIKEMRNITGVRTHELADANGISSAESVGDAENPDSQVELISPNEAKIHFEANEEKQKEMARKLKKDESKGVNGQFSVEYDVARDPAGGQVIVNDGYFVHFFAPPDLPVLPKHVVFVLDTSGSMMGQKIMQLKQAMNGILDDLHPNDLFTIIEFSYSVTVRNLDTEVESAVFQPYFSDVNIKPKPFPATPQYIQKAKAIVDKMTASGGTNIYDALKMGLEIAKAQNEETEQKHQMIIFLTDGEPTVGNTNLRQIRSSVETFNAIPKASIFSLAFGSGADFSFLKKISLANYGFARKIYEAGDAAKQLQNFYKHISSPLLSNVNFLYPEEQAGEEAVTKKMFPNYFKGSELVIAGKIPKDLNFTEVKAITIDGPKKFKIPIPPFVENKEAIGSLERHWAYLRLKQLLDEDELLPQNRNSSQKQPKDEALKLALKYSFVCPLTSLVVVKPDGNEASSSLQSASPESPISGLSFGPLRFSMARTYIQQPGVHYRTSFDMPAAGSPYSSALSANRISMVSGSMIPYPSFAAPMYRPAAYLTTTYAPSIVTDAAERIDQDEASDDSNNTDYSELTRIPWFSSVRVGDTLVIDSEHLNKTLRIMPTKSFNASQSCTAAGVAGVCSNLKDCIHQAELVSNLTDYAKNYYCAIDGDVAGFCCTPDRTPAQTTATTPIEDLTTIVAEDVTPTPSSSNQTSTETEKVGSTITEIPEEKTSSAPTEAARVNPETESPAIETTAGLEVTESTTIESVTVPQASGN